MLWDLTGASSFVFANFSESDCCRNDIYVWIQTALYPITTVDRVALCLVFNYTYGSSALILVASLTVYTKTKKVILLEESTSLVSIK